MTPALQREALRQRMLLRALWRDSEPGVAAGWLRGDAERGLQTYRANAGALAERALLSVYPTLAQLLGADSFAALARAVWSAQPPERGDLALWGGALADFIAADAQLAPEPYLADVARLEWAVHTAEQAADGAVPTGLDLLATGDPARLILLLQPGTTLLSSPHPVATIWHAHRSSAADRFDSVRAGVAEHVLVRRRGWRAEVLAIDAASACYTAALLAGDSLSGALLAAGSEFAFEPWLLITLQAGALAAVQDRA